MIFGPAGNRRCLGFGRPRRPQKPFQKVRFVSFEPHENLVDPAEAIASGRRTTLAIELITRSARHHATSSHNCTLRPPSSESKTKHKGSQSEDEGWCGSRLAFRCPPSVLSGLVSLSLCYQRVSQPRMEVFFKSTLLNIALMMVGSFVGAIETVDFMESFLKRLVNLTILKVCEYSDGDISMIIPMISIGYGAKDVKVPAAVRALLSVVLQLCESISGAPVECLEVGLRSGSQDGRHGRIDAVCPGDVFRGSYSVASRLLAELVVLVLRADDVGVVASFACWFRQFCQ
jgi:hypothetical protein